MGAGGGLGKALFNPLGHEKVSVVAVAGAAVKLVGGDVRSHDFEVNGPDIAGSCLVLDKLESLASPALAAMGLPEIELIDKGVATEILEAISEGQDDVTHRCFRVTDEPGPAERGLAQKRDKSDSSPGFVVGVAVIGVVLAHHRKP